MLFQTSIRRELSRSFGAALVILVTIVLTIVLIRTLGQASRGSVDPQDVVLFMAYSTLGRLPTILTLSLFIAMVGTLSRMYSDSEMVVWLSSGKGLMGLFDPLFRFAWPVLLIITLMGLFVWPWSNQQTDDMRQRYESRGDLDRVAPGQFQESANGNRVFFIDRDTTPGPNANSNVFIAANENGKSTITTARSGRVEMQGDQQVLMLGNGQRIENLAGKPAVKIIDFQEYGNYTGASAPAPGENTQAKLKSSFALLLEPTRVNLSELAWRIGLGLSAANFVLVALALGSVNPRGGRSGNMIFVLLSFVVYNNLLNLGQSWMNAGVVSFGVLMLAMHGGVALLAMTWLVKRHNNWTLRAALRSRPSPAAGGAA